MAIGISYGPVSMQINEKNYDINLITWKTSHKYLNFSLNTWKLCFCSYCVPLHIHEC